ncbi:MAG: anti-sigma regulatory factor [bacterium]|nr:anti-sigma regulatory factor [bacterium]
MNGSFDIISEEDVLHAGNEISRLTREKGFSILDRIQIRTAFSELARNMVVHAGGGKVQYTLLDDWGLQLVFEDHGPGIPDIGKAMSTGFSTTKSMGLGLPGSKKLADDFHVVSKPGEGTKITFFRKIRNDQVNNKNEGINNGQRHDFSRGERNG